MSYGGHLSYRLVYNNLSNAAHNTMRPLKSKGVHCIKIRVISQKERHLRMQVSFFFVCRAGICIASVRTTEYNRGEEANWERSPGYGKVGKFICAY